MGNLKNILLALMALPLLGACTSSLGLALLDADIEACKPEYIRQARQFKSGSSYLESGLSKGNVLNVLGAPEKNEFKRDRNGQTVELLLYRTGHKSCNYMPTEEPYTTVILYKDMYWGHGEEFARTVLR